MLIDNYSCMNIGVDTLQIGIKEAAEVREVFITTRR